MPRRVLKRMTPSRESLRDNRWLRPFAHWLGDPRLWSLQRRPVARAFGAGLAICFVPLPIHLPLAALVALWARVNVPTIIATVLLVNPLTMVPVYYFAYRVGLAVTDFRAERFRFELSWDWLQHGLGPLWQPFLIGCLVCSVVLGLAGWALVSGLWRWAVIRRKRGKIRVARLDRPGAG
jgi:uncharacterized protein